MFKIQTLNKISTNGLRLLPPDNFEYASEIVNPDAMLVRSFNMLDMDLPQVSEGDRPGRGRGEQHTHTKVLGARHYCF